MPGKTNSPRSTRKPQARRRARPRKHKALSIDIASYLGRKATLRTLCTLALKLRARAPKDASALERARLASVMRWYETASQALAEVLPTPPTVRAPRLALLAARRVVTAVLDAHVRAGDATMSKRARSLRVRLFRRTGSIARSRHGEAATMISIVREAVERDAAVRQDLAAFGLTAAVQHLFAMQDALDQVARQRALAQARRKPHRPTLVAKLNQHIDHYATAVIAAIDPDDPDTFERAEQALLPLREVDIESSKRRRRRKRAKKKKAARAATPA